MYAIATILILVAIAVGYLMGALPTAAAMARVRNSCWSALLMVGLSRS